MEKIDIKYSGIPNVCFSLTSPDDLREEKLKQQRIERGFDDSETWSLRDTIGRFILPRLIVFRKIAQAYPAEFKTIEEWQVVLDKIIIAFELMVRDDGIFLLSNKETKEFNKGLKLYNKYFMDLWW